MWLGFEDEVRVLQPLVAQHLFTQREYWQPGYTTQMTDRKEVTSCQQRGIGRDDDARTQRRVLHEEASNQVVPISDAPG